MHIIIIIKYKANILLFFLLLQIDTDFLNCEDFLVGDPTPCYVCHTAATRPSKERQTLVLGRYIQGGTETVYTALLHPCLPPERRLC